MNLRIASALALSLLACNAMALKSDRQQPIDLAADHFDGAIAETGETRIRGNVQISQGSLKIAAAEAVITREQGAFKRAVLTGAPATVEQTLDTGGQMRSQARKIEYDMAADTLLLTGDVVITQPEGNLRGERVHYDIGTGKIDAGGEGGRVRMHIPAPAAQDKTD